MYHDILYAVYMSNSAFYTLEIMHFPKKYLCIYVCIYVRMFPSQRNLVE